MHASATGPAWVDLARRVEDLGYSTLLLPDHFDDQLSPMPALAVAAAVTTGLRVGPLVLDNDYRHPVVLAKEAATVDVLSGGRLELGLGAGWMRQDYERSGIAEDPPSVRVDRMVEAVDVLEGLWSDGPLDHAGTHYRVSGLDGLPKPVQRPHPPLLIGGGSRRVLSFAARRADIVGINPSIHSGAVDAAAAANGAAAATDRKVAWVREAAGGRIDELELNMLTFAVIVTEDRRGTLEAVAPAFGLPPEVLEDYPHALVGTEAQIAEQLQASRERWGVSYWVVQGDAIDALAPVVARLSGT